MRVLDWDPIGGPRRELGVACRFLEWPASKATRAEHGSLEG